MKMSDELDRIGREMLNRRMRSAEDVARYVLAMTPLTNETAQQFADRIRRYAESHHPSLVARFEHVEQNIYKRADDCGCSETDENYEDNHCESSDEGEDLCSAHHLGSVCANCENEDGDGPSWKADRYEWPCPAMHELNKAMAIAVARPNMPNRTDG